jgi:hypothetical protein
MSVENNGTSTDAKKLGGVTGKGFLPGRSGNPGGRPKHRPISDRYKLRAETPLDERRRKRLKLPKGATYGDALALAQFLEGIDKRKAVNAREIREGAEGRATQRIEIIGEDIPVGPQRVSIHNTIVNIRQFYGLVSDDPDRDAATTQPARTLSVPKALDIRSKPPKARDEG